MEQTLGFHFSPTKNETKVSLELKKKKKQKHSEFRVGDENLFKNLNEKFAQENVFLKF